MAGGPPSSSSTCSSAPARGGTQSPGAGAVARLAPRPHEQSHLGRDVFSPPAPSEIRVFIPTGTSDPAPLLLRYLCCPSLPRVKSKLSRAAGAAVLRPGAHCVRHVLAASPDLSGPLRAALCSCPLSTPARVIVQSWFKWRPRHPLLRDGGDRSLGQGPWGPGSSGGQRLPLLDRWKLTRRILDEVLSVLNCVPPGLVCPRPNPHRFGTCSDVGTGSLRT